MCGHRFAIERRPADDERGERWEELDGVGIHDLLRVREEELARARAQALRVASAYAWAAPGRAGEIVLQRYSCNGPEGEAERPFAEGLPQADPEDLARRLVALRQALAPYAEIKLGGYGGELRISLPEGGAEQARAALEADAEAPR